MDWTIARSGHRAGPLHPKKAPTIDTIHPRSAGSHPGYNARHPRSKLSRNRPSLYLSEVQVYMCISVGASLLMGVPSSLSLCMSLILISQHPPLLVYLLLSSRGRGCVATQASTGTGIAVPWGLLCSSGYNSSSHAQRGPLYHQLDHHPMSRLPHPLDHHPLVRLPHHLDHRLVHRHNYSSDPRQLDRPPGLTQLDWTLWLLVILATLLAYLHPRMAGLLARVRCCNVRSPPWPWNSLLLWRSCVLRVFARSACRFGDRFQMRCKLGPSPLMTPLAGSRELMARTATMCTPIVRHSCHPDWMRSVDLADSRPSPCPVRASSRTQQSNKTHTGFRRRVKCRERLQITSWNSICRGIVLATCKTQMLHISLPAHWRRLCSSG